MDKYLIAHDLGTSGDKASLFSIEGKLVKSYTASYKTHYFHNSPVLYYRVSRFVKQYRIQKIKKLTKKQNLALFV